MSDSRAGNLATSTLIWRDGWQSWVPLPASELGTWLPGPDAPEVPPGPPPTPGRNVSNAYVWALAAAPVVSALLTWGVAALLGLNAEKIWGVAVALNIALCVMDSRRLTKAGHDIAGWWVLIVPVYLFKRAKHLGQQPWYALTWLVVLVLSVVAVPAPDYSTPKITTYQGQLLIPGQATDFSPSGHLTFDQAANPVSNGQLSVKYDFTAGADSWQISKARIELVDPKGQIATPSTGGTLTDLRPGQDSQGVMTFNVVASPPSGTYVLRYHCITHECSVDWKITVP